MRSIGAQLRRKAWRTVGCPAPLGRKRLMRRDRLPSFNVGADILDPDKMIDVTLRGTCSSTAK